MRYSILFAGLLGGFGLLAQECVELDRERVRILQEHINFLASDALEGREPGTAGEGQALRYIERVFRQNNLVPAGTHGFVQPFDFPDVAAIKVNQLEVKEKSVKEGYYPVAYSSNGVATGKTLFVGFGIQAPELDHDDYKKIKDADLKGRIAVMDVGAPDGVHPHSKYLAYHDLLNRMSYLTERGVVGIVLVSFEGAHLPRNRFTNLQESGVPVLAVTDSKLAKKIKNKTNISFSVEIEPTRRKANNVVGYLDHGAPRTIVIGAHYDHLGMGGDNSLYRGEPAIHNGADDNASGTAGLLELVRTIAANKERYNAYNFLFVAFSAEERGLLGSKYFVDQPRFEPETINCMINMDMIGRLDKENKLAVSGVGTSPEWLRMIKDIQNCTELAIKTSESGVGPSDHTSFYNKGIPVLHFFTGTHEDYHKPSDDANKINYMGEAEVLRYIENLLVRVCATKDLEFTQTKEEDSQKAPRFSVTLGIMPDYMFEGPGVRVDGVTEGKPAANAGLVAGDIIVKLGDLPVRDMMGYMQALSAFKPGDKTSVTYKRGGKESTSEIEF